MEKPNSILDSQSIKNILTLRYNPTKKSKFTKKIWNDFVEKSITSPQIIENLICSNLQKSIKNSTYTKTSVALSSGVDSTLVLALLKKTCPNVKINAISIRFQDSIDESKHAAKIASKFDIDHNIVYVENYLKDLPHAISIIKQPFWDLHWYHVVKKAKTLGTILVSGDGGDELFGGYTFRYKKFLSLTTKNSSPTDKVKAYLQCHERDWVEDQRDIFGKKLNFNWNDIYKQLLPYFDNPLNLLSQIFLADFNGKLLYNWIPLNTSFHNYFKVKPVTPLLSKEIIQHATHLPINVKYNLKTNAGKLLLREILHKYSLDKLLIKKKQGFSVDTKNLWRTYGYDLCDIYLSNARIVQFNWINKDWIQKYLDKNKIDIRYVNKFLGLLALEIWCRIFITKEMNPKTKLT